MTVEEKTFEILQENKSFGMSIDELYNQVRDKFPNDEPGSVYNEVAVALDKGLKARKIKKTTGGFYCWIR